MAEDRRPHGCPHRDDIPALYNALESREVYDHRPMRNLKAKGRALLLEHLAKAKVWTIRPGVMLVEVITGGDAGKVLWLPSRFAVDPDEHFVRVRPWEAGERRATLRLFCGQ